uniref:Tryptophan aminotransferase-related protein 4 n=1 Tax=Anthurium amnicola TaxID=1678845 RepID=A0A1D1Z982_9ARAE
MGAGVIGLKHHLLLTSSLLLNLFLSLSLFLFSPGPELGWSRTAASQAETVAAIDCSGHGRAFLDGTPVLDGEGRPPRCECNTCYAGHDCSELLPDCPADVDSGDPLFLEPYWRQHASASAVLVAGWHRMSYGTGGESNICVELEKHIRLLHASVGNAIIDGRFIVFGTGSTQLINAAVYALSPDNSTSPPATVVASAPYYPLYERQTTLFDSKENEWGGATSACLNASASSTADFIEFVTSPNNPDGQLMEPALGGSSVIYDHAYYWPHFTSIPAPADGDLMLFTMSKVSGHAGSRFGWAIVKDESIYRRMYRYLELNTMGVSRDTQLRILTIVKAIVAGMRRGGGDNIFLFGPRVMQERWRKVNELVSASRRFSLQQLVPRYCTYFDSIRDPSPAYGWLKCEMEEDVDCKAVIRSGGIIGRPGSAFGADPRYVRLSLIKTQDDFDQLLGRLEALVAREGAASL